MEYRETSGVAARAGFAHFAFGFAVPRAGARGAAFLQDFAEKRSHRPGQKARFSALARAAGGGRWAAVAPRPLVMSTPRQARGAWAWPWHARGKLARSRHWSPASREPAILALHTRRAPASSTAAPRLNTARRGCAMLRGRTRSSRGKCGQASRHIADAQELEFGYC